MIVNEKQAEDFSLPALYRTVLLDYFCSCKHKIIWEASFLEEWSDEFESELYDINGQYQGVWQIGFLPYANQIVFIRELPEINQDNQGNINANL